MGKVGDFVVIPQLSSTHRDVLNLRFTATVSRALS